MDGRGLAHLCGNADLVAFPAANGRTGIFDTCKAFELTKQRNRVLLFRLIFVHDSQSISVFLGSAAALHAHAHQLNAEHQPWEPMQEEIEDVDGAGKLTSG
jgi:hypothetical protein